MTRSGMGRAGWRAVLLAPVLAAAVTACGSVVAEPPHGAATATATTADPEEEWNRRLAENHRYREERGITAEQRAAAAPRAEALVGLLTEIAGRGSAADAYTLRRSVAEGLGVAVAAVDLRGERFDPLRNARVSVAQGPVCVKATVDEQGAVRSEVSGMILDGGCLPAPGH